MPIIGAVRSEDVMELIEIKMSIETKYRDLVVVFPDLMKPMNVKYPRWYHFTFTTCEDNEIRMYENDQYAGPYLRVGTRVELMIVPAVWVKIERLITPDYLHYPLKDPTNYPANSMNIKVDVVWFYVHTSSTPQFWFHSVLSFMCRHPTTRIGLYLFQTTTNHLIIHPTLDQYLVRYALGEWFHNITFKNTAKSLDEFHMDNFSKCLIPFQKAIIVQTSVPSDHLDMIENYIQSISVVVSITCPMIKDDKQLDYQYNKLNQVINKCRMHVNNI